MRFKTIHASKRHQTRTALTFAKPSVSPRPAESFFFFRRQKSRVRIRTYRYGLYEKQYRYRIRYDIDKSFHIKHKSKERVPVPVQACADRGVGCIFSSKKTTTDAGTVKSESHTMSLHTWSKNKKLTICGSLL
jgi:hypothetical protein